MSLTAAKISDYAMHYLQRYSSSTENLRRVLTQKMKRRQMRFHDVPDNVNEWIDQAVDKCVRLKLVDDHAYTEGRINALRRQGRSKHYILRTLTQKGVDKKIVLNYLAKDDENGEDAELKAAQRYAAKKRLGNKTDREARQKDLMKMLRAGYAPAIAKQALQSDVDLEESFDE